jgi:hypothetical protein
MLRLTGADCPPSPLLLDSSFGGPAVAPAKAGSTAHVKTSYSPLFWNLWLLPLVNVNKVGIMHRQE